MRRINMELSSEEAAAIQTLSELSGDRNATEFFRSAANFYAWYLQNMVYEGATLLIDRGDKNDDGGTMAAKVYLLTKDALMKNAKIKEAKTKENELTDE